MERAAMKWLYMVLIVLFIFLFVGGPGYYSDPIVKELWDAGHPALFAIAVFVLLRRPRFRGKNPWIFFGLVTLLCLAAGLATEALQIPVGRDFELKDIRNDTLGGILGWAVVAALDKNNRRPIRISMLAVMLLILCFVLGPVCRAAFNAAMIRWHFPVLSDFETPFELDRWEGKFSSLNLDTSRVRHGKEALRMELEPGIYPGISSDNFRHDWRGYGMLQFSLYNTTTQTLVITLRVHDRMHRERGFEYIDRFNRRLTLLPGWNDIRVPLSEIQSAPRGRAMDMSNIENLCLFFSSLDKPVTMYFDYLRLTRE